MKITISFKNMEHTPSLDERIREKAHKVEKFWEGKTEMKWTCWVTGGEHHAAEVNVHGARHEYHAHAKSDDLYKTLDLVIDKVQRQVEKDKDKIKNKMHRAKSELVNLSPSAAWGEFEAWQEEQKEKKAM